MKKLISILLSVFILCSSAMVFADVTDDLKAVKVLPEDVIYLSSSSELISRGEFAQLTARLLTGEDMEKTGTIFSDVDETNEYSGYISYLANRGIINGTDESLFGVGEPVSRQDIAVMTVRALDYKQILLEPVLSHFGYFFDSDSISDYAQDAVMTMYVSGFVSGDEDYRFNPHSPATRAEVAKIIYMLVDYIERI